MREDRRRGLAALALNILTAALAQLGTVQHFMRDGWAMEQYYTLQSNSLLFWACALAAWRWARVAAGKARRVPSWVGALKYLAVCTTTMTFTVVVFVLAPMFGWAAGIRRLVFSPGQICHHLLCPLLGLLTLVFVERPDLSDKKLIRWAAGLTLLYSVLATAANVMGIIDGPYPFLRVTKQPLWQTVLWYIALLALAWALAWLVWRLTQRFARRRELTPPVDESGGWSADGYIIDQDRFSSRRYRTVSADNNSCGPIAAFDLRRFMGQEADFDGVLRELESLHALNLPGPTYMRAMRRYLDRYLPGYREVRGREAGFRAAEGCRMAIFRYLQDRVPHFVACYALGGGQYRFFNIKDGLTDCAMTLAAFRRDCCHEGPMRVMYWQ